MPIQGIVSVSSASTLTLTAAASIYSYTGSAAATWTLPAVSGNGGELLILYNRGTGAVTVQRAGTDQINNQGALVNSITLSQNKSMQLLNDGTYWLVVTSSPPLPTYDNSAVGANKLATNVASGTPYTWTQTVSGNGAAYGLVSLYCMDLNSAGLPTSITSAVVTFGGVTLNPLAFSINNSMGWLWVFGGAHIPTGSQTVSVTLTSSGESFGIIGASATYLNVAGPGIIVASSGNHTSASARTFEVSVPRVITDASRMFCATMWGSPNALTFASPTQRQSGSGTSGTCSYFIGDTGASGPETQNMGITTAGDGPFNTIGAELYGRLPSSPYTNTIGTAVSSSGGSSSHTFQHTALSGAYVLVAVSYRKSGSSSLGAVTYDGLTMTQISSAFFNNDATGTSGELFVFGIANVSGGLKTVSVTWTGSPPTAAVANSVSYMGVNTVTAGTSATGNGSSLSQGPIACVSGQVIAQFFGSQATITETDSATNLYNGSTAGIGALSINQSVAASTTFTATTASSQPWAAINLVLS